MFNMDAHANVKLTQPRPLPLHVALTALHTTWQPHLTLTTRSTCAAVATQHRIKQSSINSPAVT